MSAAPRADPTMTSRNGSHSFHEQTAGRSGLELIERGADARQLAAVFLELGPFGCDDLGRRLRHEPVVRELFLRARDLGLEPRGLAQVALAQLAGIRNAADREDAVAQAAVTPVVRRDLGPGQRRDRLDDAALGRER